MSPHPQDSAVSRCPGVSTLLVLLLLSGNSTVEVTKPSLPSPRLPPAPALYLTVSCDVVFARSAQPLPSLTMCSSPAVRCIVAFSLLALKSPSALRLVFRSPPGLPLPLRDLTSLGQNCRTLHWFVSYRHCLFCPSL